MSTLVRLMSSMPGTVERAYQLAAEGKSVSEILKVLKTEGYSDAIGQVMSPSVKGELTRIARRVAAEQAEAPSEP